MAQWNNGAQGWHPTPSLVKFPKGGNTVNIPAPSRMNSSGNGIGKIKQNKLNPSLETVGDFFCKNIKISACIKSKSVVICLTMKLKSQYTIKVTTVVTGKVKIIALTKKEILADYEGINTELKLVELLDTCFQAPNQTWEFVS